jgi:esterase/lipase superfamily enzyme
MPTPSIYTNGPGYPESGVAPGLRSNEVDLLFATDRVPESAANGTLAYGSGRSASVGFGSAIVEIGDDLSWKELVEISEASSRSASPAVRVKSRAELGRFPSTPHAFQVIDGRVREDPVVRAEFDRAAARFREELGRRLWQSEKQEVQIFVHGFNDSFDSSAKSSSLKRGRLAEARVSTAGSRT